MKTIVYILMVPLIGYVLAWALCFVCLAGAYLSAKYRQDNPNKQTNH